MPPPLPVENVAVKIMGRDYVFACSADERDSLLECVALVDAKMNAVKAGGKLGAVDRIAVMAALNIANELVSARRARPASSPSASSNATLANEGTALRMQSLSEEIRRFVEETAPRVSNESRELFGR